MDTLAQQKLELDEAMKRVTTLAESLNHFEINLLPGKLKGIDEKIKLLEDRSAGQE